MTKGDTTTRWPKGAGVTWQEALEGIKRLRKCGYSFSDFSKGD